MIIFESTPNWSALFDRVVATVDMFPSTDSAKNAVDIFPPTDDSKDIHSVLSSHVECVTLIKRKDT